MPETRNGTRSGARNSLIKLAPQERLELTTLRLLFEVEGMGKLRSIEQLRREEKIVVEDKSNEVNGRA